MEEGRGINVKRFGTYTFEPVVAKEGNIRNKNAASVSLRPCFIPSPQLAEHLGFSPLKDELEVHVEGSIYQQGVRVSYLNSVPIAKGCYYNADFVLCAIDAIFKGIQDLAMRGYNLEIELEGFSTISIVNRSLKSRFSPSLSAKVCEIEKAYPLKSVNGAMSATQVSKVHEIMHSKRKPSKLDTLQRPNSSMLKDIKQRINRLTESSKDMCNIISN
jgi:hypothetical protein